jgi:hypothetical protein
MPRYGRAAFCRVFTSSEPATSRQVAVAHGPGAAARVGVAGHGDRSTVIGIPRCELKLRESQHTVSHLAGHDREGLAVCVDEVLITVACMPSTDGDQIGRGPPVARDAQVGLRRAIRIRMPVEGVHRRGCRVLDVSGCLHGPAQRLSLMPCCVFYAEACRERATCEADCDQLSHGCPPSWPQT